MRALQKLPQVAFLIGLAATTQVATASCYTVYAPDNTVVFRSSISPVDLSKPLHQTLPAVAPGGRLVFSPASNGCEVESDSLDSLRKMSMTAGVTGKRAQQRRKMRAAQGA